MPSVPRKPRHSVLIEARYLLVTPAYLRGADQEKAEIRSASFKGVLRYWWRALQWPVALAAANGDVAAALAAIHSEEASLFGIAASAQQASGQGAIRQLVVQTLKPMVPTGPEKNVDPLDAYMLGQGLAVRIERATRTTSTAIPAGTQLVVSLLTSGLSEPQRKQLGTALQLLGSVGGIGARTRRGVGSLAIEEIVVNGEKCILPENPRALHAWLVDLKAGRPPGAEPSPYTAVDEAVRFTVVPNQNLAELKRKVAGNLNQFRTYGRADQQTGIRKALNGTVIVDGQQRFKKDHDWVLGAIRGTGAVEIPERTAFGLPHNYFFSNGQGKADVGPVEGDLGIARRASPLLVHYHRFAKDNSFCAVISHWPAKFLPEGTKIEIVVNGRVVYAGLPRSSADNSKVISEFRSMFSPKNK